LILEVEEVVAISEEEEVEQLAEEAEDPVSSPLQ
jgi:hypothetical protein